MGSIGFSCKGNWRTRVIAYLQTILVKLINIYTVNIYFDFKYATALQVSEWYSGWKSMFNDTPLEKDETVLGYFNLALEMMQAVLAYDPDEEPLEGIADNVGCRDLKIFMDTHFLPFQYVLRRSFGTICGSSWYD